MNEEDKCDVWNFKVRKTVIETVIFNEPVTKEEALKIYEDGDFRDIIDEDDYQIEEVLSID